MLNNMSHWQDYRISVNNLNLFDLSARYDNLTRLALQYNPELVAIFIDIRLKNIVIASYHGYDQPNREFIDEINRQFVNPVLVFEYGNLPNTNEQHNLNAISRFLAKRNETNENVIVTSGHCYQFEPDYFLKLWVSLNVHNYIGKMSRISLHHMCDFGIVSIEDNVEPRRSIRNTDSSKYQEIYIDSKNDTKNNHLGIHSCKSGYFTHLTCGYLRSNKAIYPYKISYVINIENHIYDIGGPVLTYIDINHIYLSGILTSGIGNIGFVTNIDSILMRRGLLLEL
ncbi:hypothetical protein F8M41_004016 [Gigaspora margarita]|uniref:Uncharacterized protein n=1 Tax=Gigaspora margarita TaxID=4874 RepID=A0A8H4A5S4_GIGMA|nr:hypothetical protein F8M41_004016 [Gigaspora margarita]